MNKGYSIILMVVLILLSGCSFRRNRPTGFAEDDLYTPGTHSISFDADGTERSFLLFTPGCNSDAEPLPLVLMFHGGGGSAEGVSRDTGWSDLAERECLLVAYPEGLPSDIAKPPSFLKNPQLWNDGSGRFNGEVDDIGFVEDMVVIIGDNFPIDPGRIYATGFSNGASMAFRVGIELQDIFSAIAPVSGALWCEDFLLSTPVSLLYMTGTADPLNPMEGGVPKLATGDGELGGGKAKPPVIGHVMTWSEVLGCDPSAKILVDEGILRGEVFRDCAGGSEVQYYTLEGIGHHWPGGKIRLPESLVGEGTDQVQATEIIWDFFESHSRP